MEHEEERVCRPPLIAAAARHRSHAVAATCRWCVLVADGKVGGGASVRKERGGDVAWREIFFLFILHREKFLFDLWVASVSEMACGSLLPI